MRRLAALLLMAMMLAACAANKSKSTGPVEIAVPYEITTLDPHSRNTISNFALLSHFYEPLVVTDPGMKIQPCLARSWENPDQLTWIFYLQPSAHFHDGKQMTSADVVYTFQRLLKNPELEISGYLTDISDIKAEGPLAVKIKTVRPMNILLNKLRFVAIVPVGTTSDSLERKVNGTGPYLFQERSDKSLRMIRNDNYWSEKPQLKTVTFLLGITPKQGQNLLQSGQAKFVQCNSKAVEAALSSRGFHIYKNDSLFLKFISYDMFRDQTPFCNEKKNPFKNRMVREAIHLALDRHDISSKLSIYASPATQPLPPFVFGYNPDIPLQERNMERSASLMSEAGYPNGFSVTMHYRSNVEDAANIVKVELAKIGIRIELKTEPSPEFLSAVRKHEYSFFVAGMGCPTGDASDVLDASFHSQDSTRRYGALNYGGYSNPDVDRAIEDSAQVARMDERRNSIQKIMTMVMQDLPWIPVYIDQDMYAVDPSLSWKPRNDSFIFAWEMKLN